jgi:hypothetical protein
LSGVEEKKISIKYYKDSKIEEFTSLEQISQLQSSPLGTNNMTSQDSHPKIEKKAQVKESMALVTNN